MNPVLVVDTNVVVAGLITRNPESPVAVILDGMLNARIRFAVSPALLAEYRSVLLRSKLIKLHQLTEAEIDLLLATLVRHAIVLQVAKCELIAPDPGDQFLWDLMASREDLMLITGDKLLLEKSPLQGRITTPQGFAIRSN